MTLTEAQIRALPNVLLHEHLDGGLRPETMIERYAAMLAGEHITTAEDRAALHTAPLSAVLARASR